MERRGESHGGDLHEVAAIRNGLKDERTFFIGGNAVDDGGIIFVQQGNGGEGDRFFIAGLLHFSTDGAGLRILV